MCKRIMKDQTLAIGDVPFYKIGTFGKNADAYISRTLFEEYKRKYSYPTEGTVLISASGTIGRTVVYDGEDAYFQDSNIIWIENDETLVLNNFLFYMYSVTKWPTSKGGGIDRLYNKNLEKILIPIPPIEIQKIIVDALDKFSILTASLQNGLPAEIEARRQQYEYYRNKLLTF